MDAPVQHAMTISTVSLAQRMSGGSKSLIIFCKVAAGWATRHSQADYSRQSLRAGAENAYSLAMKHRYRQTFHKLLEPKITRGTLFE